MPLQNRVTPEAEIVAAPHRGTMMGIRGGCIHGPGQRLCPRKRWAGDRWICCQLAFKGRRRALMQPGRYTELFFLDEATAFAAGHRPCFECRRPDAERFRRLWADAAGLARPPMAGEMDRALHAERVGQERAKRVHAMAPPLPFGTMIRTEKGCAIVLAADDRSVRVSPWSFAGYGPPQGIESDVFEVLTPPSTVRVLLAGYRPDTHATLAAT